MLQCHHLLHIKPVVHPHSRRTTMTAAPCVDAGAYAPAPAACEAISDDDGAQLAALRTKWSQV
jgi:hypothetical protein